MRATAAIKKFFLLLAAILLPSCFSSQVLNSDSLYRVIQSLPENITRLYTHNLLESSCKYEDILKYSSMTMAFADKLLRKTSEYTDSILHYKSVSYNNMAFYYQEHGKSSKAIEYLIEGIKIQEQIKDSGSLVVNLTNLATIVRSIGDTARAFTYYKRAEEIAIRKKNLNMMANLQLKLGAIYVNKRNFDTAIACYNRSLILYEKEKRKDMSSQVHRFIGIALQNQNKTVEAIAEYLQALQISTALKDLKEMSYCYDELGTIHYYQLQDFKKAQEYLLKGEEAARKGGYTDRSANIMKTLSYTFGKLKEFDQAFKYHYRYTVLNDSLEKLMEKKKSFKMNLEYEFDKKFAADSLKNLAEQRILDAQLSSHKKELQQEKTIKYTLIFVAVLILFFAYFIFNRLRHSREQNRIITEQKHQVEEQKELIEKQKEEVEEKQEEILDSIRYAKRIQQSLLPTVKYIDKHLKR